MELFAATCVLSRWDSELSAVGRNGRDANDHIAADLFVRRAFRKTRHFLRGLGDNDDAALLATANAVLGETAAQSQWAPRTVGTFLLFRGGGAFVAPKMSASTAETHSFPKVPALLRWCGLGLLVLFCLCVALQLNGSSIGMWSNLLSEKRVPSGLLFSSPKRVRGDEWGYLDPIDVVAGATTPPFPIENSNLGADRSPLIMSVPVAYYTTLFRPQLWGFFIFDFERGFSFYWCCKVFGLLFASGWWLRQMGLRSRGLVIFGAIWIFFSSYTQWWFSSPAMLPEMITSWAVCLGCAVYFLRESNAWRIAAALAGFVFFAINFVLCLYPPYQIPLLWLAVAILIGIWWERQTGN